MVLGIKWGRVWWSSARWEVVTSGNGDGGGAEDQK